MGNPLQELFEKIRALPEEKVAEVKELVDSLHHREDDRLIRGRETETTGEARGSGPEVLPSRLKAVRELSSFCLPVGDPKDLERESIPNPSAGTSGTIAEESPLGCTFSSSSGGPSRGQDR